MNSKEKIHTLLQQCSDELLLYIKNRESLYDERWVPATEIKDSLELNFVAVPKEGVQRKKTGWLFAILSRILEDQGRLQYKLERKRAFYRSVS